MSAEFWGPILFVGMLLMVFFVGPLSDIIGTGNPLGVIKAFFTRGDIRSHSITWAERRPVKETFTLMKRSCDECSDIIYGWLWKIPTPHPYVPKYEIERKHEENRKWAEEHPNGPTPLPVSDGTCLVSYGSAAYVCKRCCKDKQAANQWRRDNIEHRRLDEPEKMGL